MQHVFFAKHCEIIFYLNFLFDFKYNALFLNVVGPLELTALHVKLYSSPNIIFRIIDKVLWDTISGKYLAFKGTVSVISMDPLWKMAVTNSQKYPYKLFLIMYELDINSLILKTDYLLLFFFLKGDLRISTAGKNIVNFRNKHFNLKNANTFHIIDQIKVSRVPL